MEVGLVEFHKKLHPDDLVQLIILSSTYYNSSPNGCVGVNQHTQIRAISHYHNTDNKGQYPKNTLRYTAHYYTEAALAIADHRRWRRLASRA